MLKDICAERLDSQHSVVDSLSKRLLIAKRAQKWHEDRRLLSVRIDCMQRISLQSELFCWDDSPIVLKLNTFESFCPLLLAVEIAESLYCLSGCRFRSQKWRKTPKFKALDFFSVCRAILSNRVA